MIVAMLFVMPATHYKAYKHGRITMNAEAVKKQGRLSFVIDGKIATLEREIVKNFGTCGNCHEGRE